MTGKIVSTRQMERYLRIFHKTYEDAAREFIPPGDWNSLFRFKYIKKKSGLRGYISQEIGAGFEYIPKDRGIVVSDWEGRIEHGLFRPILEDRSFYTPPLQGAGGVRLVNGPVISPIPFWLTHVSSSRFMISLNWTNGRYGPEWRGRHFDYLELYGDNSSNYWSSSMAVIRAQREILVALSDLRQADKLRISLADYISRYKERTVLVLGDYGDEGMRRLSFIKKVLIRLGYDPILVEEVPEHPDLSLSQKVTTIGSVVRFVVIDNSSKSGHIREMELARNNEWITVALTLEGSHPSYMSLGYSQTSKVIAEVGYTFDTISSVLSETAKWAEARFNELREQRIQLYVWRQEIARPP